MTDQPTVFPQGTAYVEQAGWEEDEEHGRRFVARLVFPNGAPGLTAGVVWEKHPVKIKVLRRGLWPPRLDLRCLNPEQVATIRAPGANGAALAREFKISNVAVWKIRRRLTYRDLP